VRRRRPVHQPRPGHARPLGERRRGRRLPHPRVGGETQVVVGPQHDQLAALVPAGRPVGGGQVRVERQQVGVLQAAGQASVYSIGVDADQKDADPSVIASALKKVDVATYTAIKNVVDGNFQGGALVFEIKNGGAGYALDNLDVPAELKAELDKFEGQIKSGALTPPADIPA
jgi:hypothetical protein